MPTTPGGRFSPGDSDDWDLTTDLAAMQVSNESATTTQIATAIAAIPATPQNYRIGTNAQRLALSGANLYRGLRFLATDTSIEWEYTTLWVMTDTPWQTMTLTSSWVNFGTPFGNAQYRLHSGSLELRGSIKSGNATVSNPIFTLPAGYRISGRDEEQILVSANAGFADLRIASTGRIYIAAYNQGGGNGVVSLSNIFVSLT